MAPFSFFLPKRPMFIKLMPTAYIFAYTDNFWTESAAFKMYCHWFHMGLPYDGKESSAEEIAAKIGSIGSLPTYEEAGKLFCSIGRAYAGDPGRRGWFEFCAERLVHDVYTVEFIDALAEEIRRLNEAPVVEICAGDGKLSLHLSRREISVRATDKYPWRVEGSEKPVERLSHRAALRKYLPEIVIAAWIPSKTGIGSDVLRSPHVKSFIDIGETGWMAEGAIDTESWKIIDLENVGRYSLCRTDFTSGDFADGIFHSGVRLFARKDANSGVM